MIKISRWKHRLGTGVAAGILALMMRVTPLIAEPISILDESNWNGNRMQIMQKIRNTVCLKVIILITVQ